MGGPQQDPGTRGPVSVLEELMRRKGVDEAWSKLEEMQRRGVVTDKFTVSRMLMKTVGDGRSRSNPTRVYRGISLVERFVQLQPHDADEVLFNALLDTCCRMKDLARLEQTFWRMKDLGIQPSHVTLGILVKAYGQAGDLKQVLKIWDEMDEQRHQANAVTNGCMIDACVRCGSLDKAMEIFEDMKLKHKHPNTILYTTLIKGHGLEKDLDTALALFREMAKEGVPYNTITYNSMIDVCIKCSNLQAAEDLVREMTEPGSGLEPDLITYSTLLKGYCHTGELDKAFQVAETIKACRLCCDELVYNTLMDGCVKANDLSAGVGLFAEMAQAGMRPSSITHSILVRLYQRNGYKAEAFDAVAQLYLHHGLERPSGNERCKWFGRRGDRQKGAASGGGCQGRERGDRGDRQVPPRAERREGFGRPLFDDRGEQAPHGNSPMPMDQGGYGAPPRAFGGADWLPAEGGLGEGPQMPYSMDGDGWPPDMGGMMPAQGGLGEGPQMLYSMEGDGWPLDMGGMMPAQGGSGEGPQMLYSMEGDGWSPDMGGMMPAQGGSGEGPQMLYSMEGDGWSPDMGGMMPCMPPHPLEAPYPFPCGPSGGMDAPFPFLGGHAAGMKAPHPFGGG